MALLKSCLFVLVVGILSHYVGEALPRAWFHPDRFPFRAFAWEREGKIYDKLRIRDWKDQLPDMSRVMKDMIPKRVGTCPTAEKVMLLVRETCVAELIHWLLALCGGVVYRCYEPLARSYLRAQGRKEDRICFWNWRYHRPGLDRIGGCRMECRN